MLQAAEVEPSRDAASMPESNCAEMPQTCQSCALRDATSMSLAELSTIQGCLTSQPTQALAYAFVLVLDSLTRNTSLLRISKSSERTLPSSTTTCFTYRGLPEFAYSSRLT